MPSAAKQKGNSWERDVAKHLSEIFKENFMRVPNSGAYTGGTNVFRESQLTESQKRMMRGDIIMPECLSNWKIECKNYKTLDFHNFLTESKQLDKWIKQAESEYLWFLLVKITHKTKFIVFSNKLYRIFKFRNYTKYKEYIITDYNNFFEKNSKIMLQLNANSHYST